MEYNPFFVFESPARGCSNSDVLQTGVLERQTDIENVTKRRLSLGFFPSETSPKRDRNTTLIPPLQHAGVPSLGGPFRSYEAQPIAWPTQAVTLY